MLLVADYRRVVRFSEDLVPRRTLHCHIFKGGISMRILHPASFTFVCLESLQLLPNLML